MKTVFLTSSFNNYTKINGEKVATKIDNTNHFMDRLRLSVPKIDNIVFVSSNPDGYEKTDDYAKIILQSLKLENYDIKNVTILDNRFKGDIKNAILNADVVLAMGGHVPTQNKFMHKIDLPKILKEYKGVYIGQSAGSMNASKIVYSQPEEKEEFYDPNYNKKLVGLGLTDIIIMPHMNNATKYEIDGTTQYDMCLKDSYDFHHYGIVDSGFVEIADNTTTVWGRTTYFCNGKETLVCKNGENKILNLDKTSDKQL